MLSDRAIAALKKREKQYVVFDGAGNGFGVRVSKTGAKSFVMVARYPGGKAPAPRKIGDYPDISLADARETARQWRKWLEQGKDPQREIERQRREEARKQGQSFELVVDAYVASIQHLRSAYEVERVLRREFVPRWKTMSIHDITRGDVVQAVDAIRLRGHAAMARCAFATLRTMMSWAADRYELESVPTDRVKASKLVGRRTVRQRVLTDDELKAFWTATGEWEYPWGQLYRVLLMTGLRLREAGDAQRREFSGNLWVIPGDRMKNGLPHAVPLTGELKSIFGALPKFGRGDFLFSVKHGASPVTGHWLANRELQERMGAEHFVNHDLRRTFRTHLSALPVQDIVRELLLAHAKPSLVGIYDVYQYVEEKREALRLWSERLHGIVD